MRQKLSLAAECLSVKLRFFLLHIIDQQIRLFIATRQLSYRCPSFYSRGGGWVCLQWLPPGVTSRGWVCPGGWVCPREGWVYPRGEYVWGVYLGEGGIPGPMVYPPTVMGPEIPTPNQYWHLVSATKIRTFGKRAVRILLECFFV